MEILFWLDKILIMDLFNLKAMIYVISVYRTILSEALVNVTESYVKYSIYFHNTVFNMY